MFTDDSKVIFFVMIGTLGFRNVQVSDVRVLAFGNVTDRGVPL